MSQSENTKNKIFNSAVKIFSEKGFWKSKVSDIVKDAGVAQGTFYLYYKSKNDCFKQILLTLHNKIMEKLNEIIHQKSDIYNVLENFFQNIHSHKKLAKVFLFEALSGGNDFQELYYTFKKNLKQVFLNYYSYKNIEEKSIDIKITVLSGIVRELIEYDMLKEKKSLEEILTKLKKIINLIEKR